jgi:hypothetical protein
MIDGNLCRERRLQIVLLGKAGRLRLCLALQARLHLRAWGIAPGLAPDHAQALKARFNARMTSSARFRHRTNNGPIKAPE